MANLIVTFGRMSSQLEMASGARSVSVAIDGTERVASVTAGPAENVLTLHAGAACWVAVGTSPNAENATARRYLANNEKAQFACRSGDSVSVVVAS